MRDFIIDGSLKIIQKNNIYDEEKMEVFRYGLEIIYIFITKSIIIFSIAYFLGILKELIIFMLIFNLIKKYSFGMHAPSSIACLISSIIVFLSSAYICKTFILPIGFKTIVGLSGIVCMYIYSPADTEKKPIISPKFRTKLKLLSTCITVIMAICSICIENNFISNACTLSILIQCFMITPLPYKLTNQRYDNYKYYKNGV